MVQLSAVSITSLCPCCRGVRAIRVVVANRRLLLDWCRNVGHACGFGPCEMVDPDRLDAEIKRSVRRR
eukprot:7310728-Prymnesium_polylepis.1